MQITQKDFTKLVEKIKGSRGAFRGAVQQALVAATYLCIHNSGTTTPFQQILDAAGNTAHRKGITKWAETFAPVAMEKNKVILNKSAYKLLDLELIQKDFSAYVAETEMATTMWDEIAANENKTESIFNLDTSFGNFIKKLEKNGLGDLAMTLQAAEQDFMAKAIKAAQPANEKLAA